MFYLPFFLIIYAGCNSSASKISLNNPTLLVANADSLLDANPEDVELRNSIIKAYLILAETHKDAEQYEAVLNLDPKNPTATYHLQMADGMKHHKKGYKNGQWDAIQSFSKAAAAIDTLGDPYYWLGQAYEKKDELDFDLALEAYDKALALYLSEELKPKVKSARADLLKRKKTYEDFWK